MQFGAHKRFSCTKPVDELFEHFNALEEFAGIAIKNANSNEDVLKIFTALSY
jgi:hypothetical protein